MNTTVDDFKYNAVIRGLIESQLDMVMWPLLNLANFYTDGIVNISSGIFSVFIFVIHINNFLAWHDLLLQLCYILTALQRRLILQR